MRAARSTIVENKWPNLRAAHRLMLSPSPGRAAAAEAAAAAAETAAAAEAPAAAAEAATAGQPPTPRRPRPGIPPNSVKMNAISAADSGGDQRAQQEPRDDARAAADERSGRQAAEHFAQNAADHEHQR